MVTRTLKILQHLLQYFRIALDHFGTFFKELNCIGENALYIFLFYSHSIIKCHANECSFSICCSFGTINLKVAFGS